MIVGIIRRSTKKGTSEPSIERQKESIKKLMKERGLDGEGVRWIVDICSGDNPGGRIEFRDWVEDEEMLRITSHAFCESVDRWFRSWHGLKYFNEYLLPNNVQLHLGDVPNMYTEEGELISDSLFMFELQHILAHYWLVRSRENMRRGINRIRKDPEMWKKKYPGRPRPKGTR